MTTRQNDSMRRAACEIALELGRRGHVAYFAGGCVRDELLGLQPKDYDVATDATPDELKSIFNRTHGVGQSFGVVLVGWRNHSIEVTTFRAEGTYSDARRPDSITYADAETDAHRRDFTINGLFLDPASGDIIDYVGGQRDLERGVIRAIDSAEDRMREDRLRMLRAVRFAARFDFTVESGTAHAIRTGAGALEGVSRERIGQEIRWMFNHHNRATAAALLQSFQLDRIVLNEDHTDASLTHLAHLPRTVSVHTALAAWWMDRHNIHLENEGEQAIWEKTAQWRAALVLSNDEHTALRAILMRRHQIVEEWVHASVALRKRLASDPAFEDALLLIEAKNAIRATEIRDEVAELAKTGLRPAPLVTGDDLIHAGFSPGSHFGPVLDDVYDAQLEGRITTSEAGIELARKAFAERGLC